MLADSVRARDFIEAVFAGLDGYVNLRTLPPAEQKFVKSSDASALEEFIKPRRDRNCYVGVATRRTDVDGTLANCGELPAIFADLDFKDTSEADTRERLAAMPIQPSVVVASGGGLQPYWLLKEPIDLQTGAADAKTLLRRLARHLHGDLAAAEPARVLRLPNTKNFKYQPARQVRVECFEPDRRYNVVDFDDWLPEESSDTRILAGPAPDAIPAGSRNAHLTSLAGSMRRRGMAEASIASALLTENAARCRPPLPESDVVRIAKSVGRYA